MSGMEKPRIAKHEKVVVAYVHPGQYSAYFGTSMLALTLADATSKNPRIAGMLQEWSSANISSARNYLTGKFLDEYSAEWLLWVDSDMAFEPSDVWRLMAVADPVKRPVVGGLCFGMNKGRMFPTIYKLAEDDQGNMRVVRLGNYPEDSVVQVAGTGAAFLLIHRSALVAMRERNFNQTFPFFQESELKGQPVGEDITFCLRLLNLQIPVFVDTGCKIGHHKTQLLDENLFMMQVGLDQIKSGDDDGTDSAAG